MAAAGALLIAGGGLQAFAQIQAGRLAKVQGAFAEQVALRNQQALERQAKAERAASEIEESRVARQEKIVKAAQRATIGKSGVGLAGATLSVLADTAFQFSLERNLILRRGLLRSRELIARGGIMAAQGRFAAAQGRFAKRMSFFGAGGSILSSVGSIGFFSQTPVSTTASRGTTTSRGTTARLSPSSRTGSTGRFFGFR